MKAVGFFQPAHEFAQALKALAPGDELALHTDEDGHDTEAGTTGSDDVLIVFGINIVGMESLACGAGGGLGTLPEILKGAVLYEREQRIVTEFRARIDGSRMLRPGARAKYDE